MTHAPSRSGKPQRPREDNEERGGRRRRRRRRRSKRVDWAEDSTARSQPTRTEELLDHVARALEEIGPRPLHVRQIAENLAAQDVLGGEISEIERAVTAAVLSDVHRRGRASRFAVRGDARYQLRDTRVPEPAAIAERALRQAVATVERETNEQIQAWLAALGARALESLIRIYLEQEGYRLQATLAPARGLGKLIVDDPESEDGESKVLVLIVPKKTQIEPRLWDGEAERNKCSSMLLFNMGEPAREIAGDVRLVSSAELGRWLVENRLGVTPLSVTVPVLDAEFIESIGGLDT